MKTTLRRRLALRSRAHLHKAVLGAAAAGLVVATAACGGGTGADADAKITDLVIDVSAEPDSLDPMYRNTPEAQRFYRLAYSSLLKWNEDKSVAPDLAAELPQISEDRKTYTIKLRPGLKFHDGSDLDAEDVVFTYTQAAEKSNGTIYLSALAYMDSIEAKDAATVVLTLNAPYAYMESRLAMIPILSSEAGYKPNETYSQTENGSGPFKLEKVSRGDSMRLVRFDGYHGTKPAFDSVTLKVIPEEASRIARLTNGESHLAPDIPAEYVKQIKDRGHNAETVTTNISRVFFYPSQKKGQPTANTDFRLALSWAIDRGAIVNQVYKGAAAANSTYLTPGMMYHDETLGKTFGDKPDLAKAREHLAASGVTLNRKLSIIAFNSPDLVSAATIVQSNLKELGIEATVEGQDTAAFYPKLVSGDYDLIMFSNAVTAAGGFAPDYVNGGLNSASANNFNKFSDPEMDKLLNTALIAETEQERAAAWLAVQERDVVTQGNIQIVVSQTSEAWSKNLKNYQPSSLFWFNTLLDAS